MLSASVLGEVFTSPDTDSIVASIKAVAGKRGALLFDELLHGYLCDLQDDFTRLLTGSVLAISTYGIVDFLDPKILLSLLMWAVYMVMVFTRWNSGWCGRRADFLAAFAFVAAIVAWFAYFSAMHRFAAS